MKSCAQKARSNFLLAFMMSAGWMNVSAPMACKNHRHTMILMIGGAGGTSESTCVAIATTNNKNQNKLKRSTVTRRTDHNIKYK